MPMPPETQQLIEQALESVRNDPQHNLNLYQRFAIYYSFGRSRLHLSGYTKSGEESNLAEGDKISEEEFTNPNLADFALSWLAILTTKKVELIWNGIWEQIDIEENKWFIGKNSFENGLQDCNRLLLGNLTYREGVNSLYENVYWTLNQVDNRTTYDIAQAYRTLYVTVEFILDGLPGIYRGGIIVENLVAEDVHVNDFTVPAIEAYSSIDESPRGDSNCFPPPKPIKYDLSKRLEFWEWWLTEAIPQAWELAETSLT